MPSFLIYLVPALLYALVAVLQFCVREFEKNWTRYAIVPAFLLHGYALYSNLFIETSEGLNFGLGNSISTIVWLIVGLHWIGSFFHNLRALQAPIAAMAAICVLLPGIFPSPHFLVNANMFAFKIHLMIGLLAYSLFSIAALQALLMDFIEKRLHSGMPTLLKNMPPLLTMETLLFRVIGAGFILLTLTLFSGAFYSEELFGKPLELNHKTVFAFVSWAIFAVLLGGRHFYGWRGRIAVRSTMTGFILLLLAYIGSKFVLEVILKR